MHAIIVMAVQRMCHAFIALCHAIIICPFFEWWFQGVRRWERTFAFYYEMQINVDHVGLCSETIFIYPFYLPYRLCAYQCAHQICGCSDTLFCHRYIYSSVIYHFLWVYNYPLLYCFPCLCNFPFGIDTIIPGCYLLLLLLWGMNHRSALLYWPTRPVFPHLCLLLGGGGESACVCFAFAYSGNHCAR